MGFMREVAPGGGLFVADPRADAQRLKVRVRVERPRFSLDVDLVLPGHGVTVLWGPSGCGKTTLLRALAGLEPARGWVALGDDVWLSPHIVRPAHQRPIGMVFQEPSLFEHLTVRDNLLYGWRRIAPEARRVSLQEACQLLGIEALLDRRPATLSGGERQRAAIARALLTSPQLLLMDEPLSSLDGPRKAEVLPYLERLTRVSGVPMVYVTHALEEAARLADHLVQLADGRVVREGPPAEVMASLSGGLGDRDDEGALLEGRVVAHDPDYGQSCLSIWGEHLWVGRVDVDIGAPVRVRVLARDVSLARQPPIDSSLTNILSTVIDAVRGDGPESVTVRLLLKAEGASAQPLLARITRRSFDRLQLKVGEPVMAQIKSVALMAPRW